MTIANPDRLAVAQSLQRRYCDEAKRHALQRISELADEGDLVGRDLWVRVADAIDKLQSWAARTASQHRPRDAP
jgi:hypothetical protein